MARFRVFNVRVGGGRKASIGFHKGPVGVTFGGRRKKKFRYTELTTNEYEESNLSPEEYRLNILRGRISDWIFHAFVAFMVILFGLILLMTTISIVTPLLYGLLAASSIWCSAYVFVSWNRAKKYDKGEETNPSESQSKSYEFVRYGVELSELPLIGFTFKKRAGDVEELQSLEESFGFEESQRTRSQKSHLPFYMVPILNFIFNYAFIFPAAATYSSVQTLVDSDCSNGADTYETPLGVRGPCEELIRHFSNLTVSLVVVYLSIGLAFLVSIRTGAFVQLYKSIKLFSINFLESKLKVLSEENRSRVKTFLKDRNLTRRK